jgi:putative ABC transport system permease protein
MFVGDAVETLGVFQFATVQRFDRAVAFDDPVAGSALAELHRLPGVTAVEPYRSVPAILRHGHHERREAILGLTSDPGLLRIVDTRGRFHEPRDDGLVVSAKLAELLGARPGDSIEIEVLELGRPRLTLPLVATVDDMVGTGAWLGIGGMNRLMSEQDAVSGAFLASDAALTHELDRSLASLPAVAASSSRAVQLKSFRDTIARTLLRMRTVNALFSVAIACGVVATTARQSLAERARDLASLRVLGYSRRDVSKILLGEQAVLVAAAIPLGLLLGAGFVMVATQGYDTELFRVPVVIRRRTLTIAALTVLAAAVATAAWIRRSLDSLDLVAVLKARD